MAVNRRRRAAVNLVPVDVGVMEMSMPRGRILLCVVVVAGRALLLNRPSGEKWLGFCGPVGRASYILVSATQQLVVPWPVTDPSTLSVVDILVVLFCPLDFVLLEDGSEPCATERTERLREVGRDQSVSQTKFLRTKQRGACYTSPVCAIYTCRKMMIIDRERETYYALCFTLAIDDHRHMTRIMYRGRVMMIIDRESETQLVLCFTFAMDAQRSMTRVMYSG